MEFVIITGLSGAGKSLAVRCMEDLGYYCIDNLPPGLINDFINLSYNSGSEIKKTALVIDIRGGEFFDDLKYSLEDMKESGRNYKVLFLEAADEVLIRRYKETRRNHPLSSSGDVLAGIRKEREKLSEIRKMADYIIDTTNMPSAHLKEEIKKIFISGKKVESITINIMSFGFKNGIPLDADLVYDVRFIPNPFYLSSMKNLTGNNKKVKDYVLKWPESIFFVDKTYELIDYLIPLYMKEGKSNLIIAFGCTGGQHRSVVMANKFYEKLSEAGKRVTIVHRDL